MACPRCQHDNREGARFCGACGAALELAAPCPHCGSANPPSQQFCDACGHALAGGPSATTLTATPPAREPRAYTPRHLVEKILGTRSALEGERKQVTVLFADVVESMRLAEWLGPEPWHRVLDRVFEILIRGVHRFEGTINQFTGDGIMALFGAPVAHEDHAQRGCHAALASAEELSAYARTLRARSGLDLAIRMGLNSGEVVVGKIGDDLRMDYTAQGHCVGLAARVEQLAAPGTVLLTEHTARLVEGFFAFRDLGARELKGVRETVRLFQLQGIGPVHTRLEAAGGRGLSRLIGRAGEFAWLEHLLASAADWNGQVVGIVGDAGVGKSRLCLEFVERCRTAGVAVYEVHCPPHGATVSWLAARELLRRCLGITDNGEPRRIEAELTAIDSDLTSAVPLVLEVLGHGELGVPGTAAEPLIRGLAGVLQRVLRARGAREPLVLVLDDAHWMDSSSHALVSELLNSPLDSRVLVIANFRSEFRPSWVGGSRYHQLALSPLGEAASHELLRELLGTDASLGQLPDRIQERTAGNPFFTEEIVQALVAGGSLVGERGAYRLTAPIETLALPATVQALLAARIDRLGEPTKQVLEAAAVIGQSFDEALLAAVSGLDDRQLATALGAIQRAELLRLIGFSPRPEYRFKHPLMREAAYRSLLDERKARLHAAVAAALERLRADRLGEHAALIAYHWEVPGMRFEAARWRRRAALKVSNIKVGGRGRESMSPPRRGHPSR
jgi:class 3 adenylate cyclase